MQTTKHGATVGTRAAAAAERQKNGNDGDEGGSRRIDALVHVLDHFVNLLSRSGHIGES